MTVALTSLKCEHITTFPVNTLFCDFPH